MINNTRGSGDILGTRMLRIRTDRIPDAMKGALGDLPPATSTRVGLLRDELHSWTFGNVRRIEEAYRKMYPRAADRSDEITAPLRVMASLAGDQELGSKLEVGLIRQSRPALQTEDPQQVVLEALKNLVAQGYDTVSPTHVTLEARKLVDQSGASSARRTPEWLKPGRVGRMLHGLDVLYEEHGGPKRIGCSA